MKFLWQWEVKYIVSTLVSCEKDFIVTVFLHFELHRSIMNILEKKKQSTIKIEWSN